MSKSAPFSPGPKGVADGSVSTFTYDDASRLTGLAHDLAGGSTNDQSFAFAYTDASQLSQRITSNDLYNWIGVNFAALDYERNGLNQYTDVGAASFTYDARGNLLSDGSRAFAYDLENRLLSVDGSAFALAYDPLGRLLSTTASAATTEFLYDGDSLVAEYSGGGTLLRRYVHGPGVDEPVVWYEGSGLTDRRYLYADERGSIIAATGASPETYSYGPYGEPDAWSGFRLRYTGQMMLPDAELYHYRARVYDPILGRFLQTDPVGYEESLNLYAYVTNDPLNSRDPSGLLEDDANEDDEIVVVADRRPGQDWFWLAEFDGAYMNVGVLGRSSDGTRFMEADEDRDPASPEVAQCERWRADQVEAESWQRSMATLALLTTLFFSGDDSNVSVPDSTDVPQPGTRGRPVPGGPGVQAGVEYLRAPYGAVYPSAIEAYAGARDRARALAELQRQAGCR